MSANPKPNKKKLFLEIDQLNKEAWDICRDQPSKSIKLAQDSLKASEEAGYILGIAKAYHTIGAGNGWLSEFKDAEVNVNMAIELFTELKEFSELALSHYSLGIINYYKGDIDGAKLHFTESYETYNLTTDVAGQCTALNGLGTLHTDLGNNDKAWGYFKEGFTLCDKIGNDDTKARIAEGMATLSRKEGDFKNAIKYYTKSYELSKKIKSKHTEAHGLEGLGESYLELNDFEKAMKYFEESLKIRKETGFKFGVAECMVSLAKVRLKMGDNEKAEKLLDKAFALSKNAKVRAIELLALKYLCEIYKDAEKWKKYAETLSEYHILKQDLSSEATLKEQNVKLEKAFDNTKVLSEIGQEIISSLELDKVLFTIYKKVNQLMDASVFGIGIYHEKEKKIEYRLAIENGKKYKPYFRDVKDKSQLAVWCVDNKGDVFINDVKKEKFNYTKGKEDLWSADLEDGTVSKEAEQSIMYVPIMRGKHVIGLITVQSFEKYAYEEQHLDILKNIAVYASIALINANVYKSLEDRIQLSKEIEKQHSKLEEAYKNNKILSEIGKDITSSLSIPEVIKKVYKNINNLMDASVFAIGVLNEEEKIIEFKGAIEKGKEFPSYSNSINDKKRPAVICLTKKKDIIINDRIRDYTKVLGQVPAPSVGDAPESIIYLPLVSKKKTLGVITVQSFKKNAYTDYHIDILKNLAVYIPIALENALLYKDMEENVKERTKEIELSYRNTKLLGEIGRDIVSARSIENIIETVYEKVNSFMDASSLAIGIYNKKEKRLEFPFDMEKGKKLPFNFDSIDDKQRLSVYCYKTQKEVFINDLTTDYNKYIKGQSRPGPSIGDQPESIIYLPLSLNKKHIGVLTVQSFNKNAYTNYHLDIVRNLATPISTAIDNALLNKNLEDQVKERTREVTEQHDQLEKTYQNTRILNEIGREITSSLSIKEVIQKVYKSINSLMDASVFLIALYNSKKNVLVFEGGMEEGKELPYKEMELEGEEKLAIICFKDRKEIIINEVEKDYKKYIKKPIVKPIEGIWMESVIYFPLISKDKMLGVFTVQSPIKNAYSEYQIDLLRNLAVYTPIALDNAMMYGRMEHEVEQRTQEVVKQKEEIEKSYHNTKLLGEIGLDVISVISIEEIADIVYKKANTLMDATSIALGLFNEKRNRIDFVSEIENGEKQPFSFVSLEDENKLSTVCFKGQTEILINDFDTEYSKYIKEWYAAKTEESQATQAIMYIPLTLKDKRIGVFTVQSFKKNVYSAYDLDILKNLGVAISTAVENATLYLSLEEKVKERTEELVLQKEKAEKLMEKAEFEKEEARYQRKRAEQSEQFKQQFLANMSHEIRTPMNAIMGMTNLLLEKNPPEQELPYLNSIKKSSESLLVIINDILDLSKIEAGKMSLEQTDFSLQEVLRLVEQTMSYRADEKGLILSVNCDDQIPAVLVGDPVRLQQVLMNIAGNAVKFTEKGGVNIRVDLEGGNTKNDKCRMRFEIRDTGIGMTREQQALVFEDFSQASADTTRKYGGTGLGLSISSKLIELFGSTIKLESEPGVGSAFSFAITLPVSKNTKAVNKESVIPENFIKELEGIRILLAEDNEYNQVVATETLELKIPKVTVTIANNGEEAFKLMEERGADFDVVLMDVQMPVMDGFDATRNIRKLTGAHSKIPIIALTASVIKKDIQMCVDAGMDGFVPKPFKTSELIEAIYKAHTKAGNVTEQTNGQEEKAQGSKSRITSMNFLKEFTEGDEERMAKYVTMYMDSAQSNLPQLQELSKEEKWDELKVLVHSMKPHFDFMGMKDTRSLAENIESILVEKKDLNTIPTKIGELKQAIEQSISELKD